MLTIASASDLSTVGTLSRYFDIVDASLSFRAQPLAKPFSPGGLMIGDKLPDTRYISLHGFIKTLAERDAIMTLLSGILAGESYVLLDGDRFIHISGLAQSIEPISRGHRDLVYHELEIPLICTDPFWYSTSLSSDEEEVTEDSLSTPHEWNISNTGAGFWGLISVEIDSDVNNYNFKIANVTDGNTGFLYQDNNNTAGSVVTVDGTAGTADRDGTSTLHAMTGNFIRLRPGVNAMKYWGKEATITTTWRQRWL